MHIKSGKCVVPRNTRNDATFELKDGCSCSKSRFAQTAKFSVKHLDTGKCFHPFGGRLKPKAGRAVVLHSGCDEDRLLFKFTKEKDGIYIDQGC